MHKWTSTVRKEIEEAATRAARADVEIGLFNWRNDQITIRQQQLEEELKKITLERNVPLFLDTAKALGLSIGEEATAPLPRPAPTTGGKRTASGSTPQIAQTAKFSPLPSVPVVTPLLQAPTLDVVTLTAAVQTAMQPFMARLAAIETASTQNKTRMEAPTPQPARAQADERACAAVGHPNLERTRPVAEQPTVDQAWVQVANKRSRKTGKSEQANTTFQQVNLTPRSYAAAATATPTSNSPHAQSQPTQPTNLPPAFTEVTVVRHGGSINKTNEQATRARQPNAIVREVRAKMARDVANPLPITSGRWSSGARSKGNFVFTMRGHVKFAFIQSFEHFLTAPFPGGGQLCPNQGWTKLLAHGVPVMDNDDIIFGPASLLQEVRSMQGLSNVYFSAPPRWIRPVGSLSSCYTSLTFAFSDPDGTITKQLFKERQALFGKQILLERWVDKPLLVQCGRCHALGHTASSKSCRLPPNSVKCYICGKGHLTDAHNRECPKSNQHKVAGTCDCRLQCLTCNKLGHHAKDRACPAREGYRSRRPRTIAKTKDKGKGQASPELPVEVSTQRPELYAALAAAPDDLLDEEMDDATGNDVFLSNFIPQSFLPGPGLSKEEAWKKMMASVEELLQKLGIPISDQTLTEEDRT